MADIVIPVDLIERMSKRGWLVFPTEAQAQAKADALNAAARDTLGLPEGIDYTKVKAHFTDPNQFAVRVEDDMFTELSPAEQAGLVHELPDGWDEVIDYGG